MKTLTVFSLNRFFSFFKSKREKFIFSIRIISFQVFTIKRHISKHTHIYKKKKKKKHNSTIQKNILT